MSKDADGPSRRGLTGRVVTDCAFEHALAARPERSDCSAKPNARNGRTVDNTGYITDENISELIERTAEAVDAYMRGDMSTYFTLIQHGDDFVLMSPFGGEPQRGVETSPESLAARQRFFRNGQAQLEVVQTYTSGDMVVVVAIERQHGEV